MTFLTNSLFLLAMIGFLVVIYRENNRFGHNYPDHGPWFARQWVAERFRVLLLLMVFAVGIGMVSWMVLTGVDEGLRVHQPLVLNIAVATALIGMACVVISLLLARLCGTGQAPPARPPG